MDDDTQPQKKDVFEILVGWFFRIVFWCLVTLTVALILPDFIFFLVLMTGGIRMD